MVIMTGWTTDYTDIKWTSWGSPKLYLEARFVMECIQITHIEKRVEKEKLNVVGKLVQWYETLFVNSTRKQIELAIPNTSARLFFEVSLL